MKPCTFACFYRLSSISGEFVEGVGDRAVIILDGRYKLATNDEIAKKHCIARGYHAYTINKGTFMRYRNVQPLKDIYGTYV